MSCLLLLHIYYLMNVYNPVANLKSAKDSCVDPLKFAISLA